MKTTKEQREELRRIASSKSVLYWPTLLDVFDDIDELLAAQQQKPGRWETPLEFYERNVGNSGYGNSILGFAECYTNERLWLPEETPLTCTCKDSDFGHNCPVHREVERGCTE